MKNSLLSLFQLIALFITPIAQRRLYQPGNITIGVLLPLHLQASINNCGKFYPNGLGYIEAISYTVAQINKNASLLQDVTLGIDVRDYCTSSLLAVSGAYNILINNFMNDRTITKMSKEGLFPLDTRLNITSPVAAVIGTEDSSSTSLVSILLQVDGITLVSPFATSEELSSPFHSTFFRTIPPDGQKAKLMADLIDRFNWQYVAAVATSDSYGRHGVLGLEGEAFERKTFCIAMIEYFTKSGFKGHLKKIVQKLKRQSNIKVIIVWGNTTPTRRFIQEASKQQLFGRTFIFSESLIGIDKNIFKDHSEVLAGSLGAIPHHHKPERFVRHLQSLTPADNPHNPWWKEFWETEFGCTTADSNNSFELCDSKLTIGHRYEKLYNSYIPYLSDAVSALAHALNLMIICKGKDPYRENCLEFLKPDKLAGYLKNVSFQGMTGQVFFNNEGNPVEAHYDIVNLQLNQIENHLQKWNFVTVGFWKRKGNYSKLTIDQSSIQWGIEQDGIPKSMCSKTCPPGFKQTDTIACCWECLECPEGFVNPVPGSRNCTKCHQDQKPNRPRTKCIELHHKYVQWDEPMAITFAALGVIGIMGTLSTTAIFILFRQTPIVKASNRELSFVMLSLILMCFVLTFLHIRSPSNTLCLVIKPGRYVICTYCVSILYLKTNRLVRAFQTTIIPSWFRKYVLDRRRQHIVVFLLNIIQIILAILWLVLDPPYLYKGIKPQEHIFLTCQPCHTSLGYGIRASMFAYLVFLSGLCTLYAFKARKLPENFNEAKFISFAMYILLVSWVVYYPVDSTLQGDYCTFVACASALLIAYGFLGCFFLPKVYIILFRPNKNTVDSVKAEVGQFSKSSREPQELEEVGRVDPTEVTAH